MLWFRNTPTGPSKDEPANVKPEYDHFKIQNRLLSWTLRLPLHHTHTTSTLVRLLSTGYPRPGEDEPEQVTARCITQPNTYTSNY